VRLFLRVWLALLLGFLAVGCGDSSHIKARGRILKGGQPYLTAQGEGLRIIFAPLEGGNDGHYDSYAAEYRPADGSFQVKGKDGAGLPAGKYRVSLELRKNREDVFGGRYVGKKSPFTLEVSHGGGDLVIDLDQPGSGP
jgi:hypothetical protein